MAITEETAQSRVLNKVLDLLIEWAERGQNTIYDETRSWEENKRLMRAHLESADYPAKLTLTERQLVSDVLKEIRAEKERKARIAQERVLRIKMNLLMHQFFWERTRLMWPYLKASERLHILQLLQDKEWNQVVLTEIKGIVENAQFFETITTRLGTTPDVEKMTIEELDLLFDLDDEALFNELADLYPKKPIASSKDKPQDEPLT